MRHFVLGLCVLTVAAPVTDAFAQNYLPARDYSGPGTIVNMDVLQSGGAYQDYSARPPILSMPLPPPAPVMAAPAYHAPQPPRMAPASAPQPLPASAAVPAIASAPVPLLPPVPMPQAMMDMQGSGKKTSIQKAVSPSHNPPQGIDPMVAAMEELPPAMPTPVGRAPSGQGLDVAPVMAAQQVPSDSASSSRHYTGGAPFADELSRQMPDPVPLITEKAVSSPTPAPMPSAVPSGSAMPAVPELPSVAHQQPVMTSPLVSGSVPPVSVAAKADRLLTPTVTTVDGVFPAPIAGGKTVNAQPLITERAVNNAAVTPPMPSMPAAVPVQKPTADSVTWDMPAPVVGHVASQDLTVPPLMATGSQMASVADAPPVAGVPVPRVPASELRDARMAALPERQLLASINDDVVPALPDPVMGRKAATYSELGVPGAMPSPTFDASSPAVKDLVVPAIPLSGQELQNITGLNDATFPSTRPVEAGLTKDMPKNVPEKTAMLAPPTAPLSGAKPSQARQLNTEDDFEAYRIFFDASSDQLKPSEAAVLNKIIGKMQGDPSVRLRMQAYASGTPDTAGQARRLSLSRAMKIRSYMTEKGIPATRLDVRALGMGSADLTDTVKKSDAPADRVDVIFIRS